MTANVQPDGALFDVVLLCHVLAAVVAMGTVAAGGVAGARVRAARRGPVAASVVRYFAPGTNWAGRTLYAVPLLGLVLLGLSHGAYGFDDTWVRTGLGLWASATALGEAVLWPAERRVQRGLHPVGAVPAAGPSPTTSAAVAVTGEVRAACARLCAAALGVEALLVAAMVVMVARP